MDQHKIPRKQAAKIMSGFQEALDKFRAENTQTDAAEPEYCACGNLKWIDQMESGVTYCDGKYLLMRDSRHARYRSDGQWISAPIPTEGIFVVGNCKVPEMHRHELKVQQIKTEYSNMLFENFERQLQPFAFDVCKGLESTSHVLLAGSTGLGKTHLMRSTFVRMLMDDKRCYWTTIPQLMQLFLRCGQKTNFNDKDRNAARDEFSDAVSAHMVFVDDLGSFQLPETPAAKHDAEFFKTHFQLLLDSIRGGFFATSNLNKADTIERYGQPIASRIFDHCKVILLEGDDYRTKTLSLFDGRGNPK